MLVKTGQQYCGQHLVEEVVEDLRKFKRIPCPLDPKHSCFEHRLQQHLEVCNAREINDLPYIKRNINLGCIGEEPPKTSLSSLQDSKLLSFIKRVEVAHKENIGSIERSELSHKVLVKEIATPGYGPSVVRHLTQNSSLLGHLDQAGFLNTSSSSTCFIEFGAGRGQLTHWLTESVTDISKSLFLLIDKGAQRYKFDAKLRYNKELFIERLHVDIQHLALEGIKSIDGYQQIVGLGKHLCGGATDLTLHCLARHSNPLVAGIVLALCCHHRCTWNTYSGSTFLQEVGFSCDEFYTLTALTSWATCNSRDVESNSEGKMEYENATLLKKDEVVQSDHSDQISLGSDVTKSGSTNLEGNQMNENRYSRLNLSAKYREEIGRKAKQLLDYGRVKYLRDRGFQCRLIQYVDKDATLENIALVAINKNWTKI